MWWKRSNLLSWGHMYQRLQRWVLDAKSMLTLTEVAVTTSVPCWVDIKHSAVEVGVGRHEPICGLLLLFLVLVVIVIIVVFSVVVVGVALTESALTEWSLAKESCVGKRKKYVTNALKIFPIVARNIEKMQTPPTIGPSPTPTPAAGIPQPSTAACVKLLPTDEILVAICYVLISSVFWPTKIFQ